MIAPGYKANFQTLKRAAVNGDLALMECRDAKTDLPVMVVCAVQRLGDDFQFVPVAKLFSGNPYEEVLPPSRDAA